MLGGGDRRLPLGGFQESGDRPESPPILHTPPRMRREEPAEQENPAKTEEAELLCSGTTIRTPPRKWRGHGCEKPRHEEPWWGLCKRLAAPLRGGVYRRFRGGVRDPATFASSASSRRRISLVAGSPFWIVPPAAACAPAPFAVAVFVTPPRLESRPSNQSAETPSAMLKRHSVSKSGSRLFVSKRDNATCDTPSRCANAVCETAPRSVFRRSEKIFNVCYFGIDFYSVLE